MYTAGVTPALKKPLLYDLNHNEFTLPKYKHHISKHDSMMVFAGSFRIA